MFRSFWMAGFECSTGSNCNREWIDQIAATQHDLHAEEDFAACRKLGLLTAREGIRWPLVDRGLRYDYRSFLPRLSAAQANGIQLIYDLFHYGYPRSIEILSDEFVERFADYCYETARFLKSEADGPYFFTPVNEPSYFAWAAGEAGLFYPHQTGQGYELKVQVARAAIQGIDAIRSVLPGARMVNADPLCRVIAPAGGREVQKDVDFFNTSAVFESWDMLAGRLLPELGGSPEHLDIVGVNYYWTNQWEWGRPESPLPEEDSRCCSLSDLLMDVYRRYGRPLVVSETAHSRPNKAWWVREVAKEVGTLVERGVPFHGVCLYPILGMPEWHDRDQWTQMGLWDVDSTGQRKLHGPMADALSWAQDYVERRRATAAGRRFDAR